MPFRDRSAHRRSFSLNQFCEITNAEILAAEEFLSKRKFADIDEAVLQYLHDKESNDDDGEEAKQYEYDTPKDRQQYQAVTTSRGRATTTKSTDPNSDKNIQMDTPSGDIFSPPSNLNKLNKRLPSILQPKSQTYGIKLTPCHDKDIRFTEGEGSSAGKIIIDSIIETTPWLFDQLGGGSYDQLAKAWTKEHIIYGVRSYNLPERIRYKVETLGDDMSFEQKRDTLQNKISDACTHQHMIELLFKDESR
jgi:hypothetical protein